MKNAFLDETTITPGMARRWKRFRAFLEKNHCEHCWPEAEAAPAVKRVIEGRSAVFLQFLTDGTTLIGLMSGTGKRPGQILYLRRYIAFAIFPLEAGLPGKEQRERLASFIGWAKRYGLVLANSAGSSKAPAVTEYPVNDECFSLFPAEDLTAWYARAFSRHGEAALWAQLQKEASADEMRLWRQCRTDPLYLQAEHLLSLYVRTMLPHARALVGKRWTLALQTRKSAGFVSAMIFAGNLPAFEVSAHGKASMGREVSGSLALCSQSLAMLWGTVKDAQAALPALSWEKVEEPAADPLWGSGHLAVFAQHADKLSAQRRRDVLQQSFAVWTQGHPAHWCKGRFSGQDLADLLVSPQVQLCASLAALTAMRFGTPPHENHNRLLAAELLTGLPT